MVISYDHEHRNARLSLRQNEILEELANDEKLKKAGGAVPGLQHTVRYSSPLQFSLSILSHIVPKRTFQLSILNMDAICLKRPRGDRTVTISGTFLK
jgi:hypothetical protein